LIVIFSVSPAITILTPSDAHLYRLQQAYERPTGQEAKVQLMQLHQELSVLNQSATASLHEGLEETLSLHALGVFPLLGPSFKTTNGLGSLNALIEERCGDVAHWKNSNQKHRWLAAALLEIEPRLQRIQVIVTYPSSGWL
jgi:putative transposase